jgi:hypothetical protein
MSMKLITIILIRDLHKFILFSLSIHLISKHEHHCHSIKSFESTSCISVASLNVVIVLNDPTDYLIFNWSDRAQQFQPNIKYEIGRFSK